MVLTPSVGHKPLLEDYKKRSVVEKTDLEPSLKVTWDNLVNAKICVQGLSNTKVTFGDLVTNIRRVEETLESSEEDIQFLEEKIAEQSSQLVV